METLYPDRWTVQWPPRARAERDTREEILDRMNLERKWGITIKAQAVRIYYHADDGQSHGVKGPRPAGTGSSGECDFLCSSREYVAALFVGAIIRWFEEETLTPGLVAVRGSHHHLTVREQHPDWTSACRVRREQWTGAVCLGALRVTCEILHKEQCLQLPGLDLRGMRPG